MEFKDLAPEQAEKVSACKTSEELVALAESEGVELTREQLDSIAGGDTWSSEAERQILVTCPECGYEGWLTVVNYDARVKCPKCHASFYVMQIDATGD